MNPLHRRIAKLEADHPVSSEIVEFGFEGVIADGTSSRTVWELDANAIQHRCTASETVAAITPYKTTSQAIKELLSIVSNQGNFAQMS